MPPEFESLLRIALEAKARAKVRWIEKKQAEVEYDRATTAHLDAQAKALQAKKKLDEYLTTYIEAGESLR